MTRSRGTLASILAEAIVAAVLTTSVQATPPGHTGGLPSAFKEKAQTLPTGSAPFRVKRGLLELTKRTQLARFSKIAIGPQKVQGVRRTPVVTTYFSESVGPPYPAPQLQQMLFDGPWPTGTMSDYYREVSSGSLALSGVVQPWAPLA